MPHSAQMQGHTHTYSIPQRLTFVLECAGSIKCFVNAYITGGKPQRTKVFLPNAGAAFLQKSICNTHTTLCECVFA